MADVVAILFCGKCLCHCFVFLADVIAIFLLADVIAIVFGWWQMLLPLWLLFLPLVGMLYIMWQMLLPSLITSAKNTKQWQKHLPQKKEWQQHLPYEKQQLANISQYTGLTPAWWLNIYHLTHHMSKNCRTYQHSDTFSVGNN